MAVLQSIGTVVFILVVGLALVAVADVLLRKGNGRRSSRTRARNGTRGARGARGAPDGNNEPETANRNHHS